VQEHKYSADGAAMLVGKCPMSCKVPACTRIKQTLSQREKSVFDFGKNFTGQEWMAKNVNTTKGYKIIMDDATCKHAATNFGKTWGNVKGDKSRPLGCYVSEDTVYISHDCGQKCTEKQYYETAKQTGFGSSKADKDYYVILTKVNLAKEHKFIFDYGTKYSGLEWMAKNANATKGYERIRDAASCRHSAVSIGKNFGGEKGSVTKPLGCYIDEDIVYISHDCATMKSCDENMYIQRANEKGYGKEVADKPYHVVLKAESLSKKYKFCFDFGTQANGLDWMAKNKDKVKGYAIIMDADECKKEATAIGKKWGAEKGEPLSPLGCYVNDDTAYISHDCKKLPSYAKTQKCEESVYYKEAEEKGFGKQIGKENAGKPLSVVLKADTSPQPAIIMPALTVWTQMGQKGACGTSCPASKKGDECAEYEKGDKHKMTKPETCRKQCADTKWCVAYDSSKKACFLHKRQVDKVLPAEADKTCYKKVEYECKTGKVAERQRLKEWKVSTKEGCAEQCEQQVNCISFQFNEEQGPACADDPAFRDEKGSECTAWKNRDCNKATSEFKYTAAGQAEVLSKCPVSCKDPACEGKEVPPQKAGLTVAATTPKAGAGVDEQTARQKCGDLCKAKDYCCNDPDRGANKYFSCAQACMLRYHGASEQNCLALVAKQAKDRGCVTEYAKKKFNFCNECKDVKIDAAKCGDKGVADGEAGKAGCIMDVKEVNQAKSCYLSQSTSPEPLKHGSLVSEFCKKKVPTKKKVPVPSAAPPKPPDETPEYDIGEDMFASAFRGSVALTSALVVLIASLS